jgi:DNA-binding Xre family transcriptional regulator
MIHRHLDYSEDVPIEQRGLMSLDDLLDRGDLGDWRSIIRAIAADPWGRMAADVLHLCDAHPMYGTSKLWRAYVASCRARRPAATLSTLRTEQGLSQAELGERLGMNQSEVSKLERRDDIRLGTLNAVVAALGGRLRLTVSLATGGDRRLVHPAGPAMAQGDDSSKGSA